MCTQLLIKLIFSACLITILFNLDKIIKELGYSFIASFLSK